MSTVTPSPGRLVAALSAIVQDALAMRIYDTWALTASPRQRELMKDTLVALAEARGKSTFGNDWQDALH